MINPQPFTIDILSTYKAFFLLNRLPKNSTDVAIRIKTPNGYEDVDFVDLFTMADGSLLAAWVHPLQKLGLQNLVASVDGQTQILNLYPVERIIDIHNRPIDSDYGVFTFANSAPVENADWRCDRGYYGAKRFEEDFAQPVITSLEDIVIYESFLSVAGAGHLMYMEIAKNTELATEKMNNSVVPTTGRTFQEVLRLIYEWSVLADYPFDSTDVAANRAKDYLTQLQLTDSELETIKQLPEMQISQYIMGSDSARTRPTNIQPLTSAVADILFDRMASSSLSFIVSRNPELWNLSQILERELDELEAGIQRFKQYYGIPIDADMSNWNMIAEIAGFWMPKQTSYIHNQLRHFTNKKAVLDALNIT